MQTLKRDKPFTMNSAQELRCVDWGLIDYQEALTKQEALVEEVSSRNELGTIVFCSHPPLVTLGRKTQPGDVFAWQGPVHEISRGGRATYHGPSQLVIYPILNLNHTKPARDLHWYLRNFEQAIIEALKIDGIHAESRKSFGAPAKTESEMSEMKNDEKLDATGVWVGGRKIASLGIAVRKWVTFHGAALNVDHDRTAFQGLKPCGYSPETMISMEELRGKRVDRAILKKNLFTALMAALGTP